MSLAQRWVMRSPTRSIATVALTALVSALMVAPAHASDPIGTAPTFTDGCEGNDFVTFPNYAFNSWFVNGTQYAHGMTVPAPATSVTVTTGGDYSGSWPYEFVNVAPCPAQAPNKFSAYAGACNVAARETPAFGVIENTVDASGLKIDVVYIATKRLQDGWDPGALDKATDILDGEVRTVPLDGTQDVGLLPGDYEVTYMSTIDPASAFGKAHFSVGACYFGVPDYPTDLDDPNDPGETDGGSSFGKPTGVLKQVRGTTKMVARGDTRKVAYTTKFKLTIDPVKGKTVIKRFKVLKNRLGKPRTYMFPARTKYVLKAQVRFLAKSGRVATKWRVIKRKVSTR